MADAVVPSDEPAVDDLATWTGSVVRDDTGRWWLFYTRVDRASGGQVQHDKWQDEAFRDSWVFRVDPNGPWHMLITSRATTGAKLRRGVVGHATSDDSSTGSSALRPARRTPASGSCVPGRRGRRGDTSCSSPAFSPNWQRSAAPPGRPEAMWWLPVDDSVGPFDIAAARRLTTEAVYSGRLIQDPTGRWVLLAFHHLDDAGDFVGEITDPVPVQWSHDDTLRLVGAPTSWLPPETLVGDLAADTA